MNVAELKAMLAKTQEPKGYFFNHDTQQADSVLAELLVNKDRYGYMACPCRLCSGDREKDKDIICPCQYREADVAEYGICFCGLYASWEYNQQKKYISYIPDRRPPEKIF